MSGRWSNAPFTSLPKSSRPRVCASRQIAALPTATSFALLDQLHLRFIIRVKGSTKVCWGGTWQKLHQVKFVGHSN